MKRCKAHGFQLRLLRTAMKLKGRVDPAYVEPRNNFENGRWRSMDWQALMHQLRSSSWIDKSNMITPAVSGRRISYARKMAPSYSTIGHTITVP